MRQFYKIDFIAIDGNKKCFIQVAYLLYEDEETIKEKNEKGLKSVVDREFGAFLQITDASPKYVLSLDKIDLSSNGVVHLNIIDFLLRKKDIYLS